MIVDGAASELERVDLRDAELDGLDIPQVCFAHSNLDRAHLTGGKLGGATLSDALLRGTDLSGADLRGADLTRAPSGENPIPWFGPKVIRTMTSARSAPVMPDIMDHVTVLNAAGAVYPFWGGRVDDGLRQADAEFHPLLQRNCFDGSVVHVGDPAHDREAEARAGQCPRLCGPVEAIEDVWQVIRGNSRPVVADLDRPAGRRDADAALRRAPFQRVVDQVADRPFQRVRVA